MNLSDLDPLEVLKQDLVDDSVEVQLDAVRAIETIALALGPQRTANELFECLEKYCFPVGIFQAAQTPDAYSNTDSLAAKEEVLCEIAQQLSPNLIEYCGGSVHACKNMLPLLEKLAMVEETVIRQASIESFNKVIPRMDLKDIRQPLMLILQRLADGDWFTSRVSASALTPMAYRVLTFEEDRRQILEIHKRLCSDDMPMVRNDAYRNLVPLIDNMQSHQLILAYTKPLLEQLCNELMENMRQSLVDITMKIAQKIDDESKQDIVPQFIKAAVDDDSWRVRKHLAEQLAGICTHLHRDRIVEDVEPLFIKLLQDSEPQVRKSTILGLGKILETTDGPSFAKPLIGGAIQALAQDSVGEVREALAEQISYLGVHLDKNVAKEKLLPILKKLAGDESAQTRLNLCSKLSNVSAILGVELFETDILPLLKEVTVHQKWRVRNSIVQNIASIGIQMGRDIFARHRLREVLVQSLKDPAYNVRNTASLQVRLIFNEFGFEWMKKFVFEEMKTIYKSSGNYLHRMIPLKAVQLMSMENIPNNPELNSEVVSAEYMHAQKKNSTSYNYNNNKMNTNSNRNQTMLVLTPKQIKTEFEALLIQALKDPISNVRFTACRTLYGILPNTDSDSRSLYRAALQKMVNEDTDQDCKYFADQALSTC